MACHTTFNLWMTVGFSMPNQGPVYMLPLVLTSRVLWSKYTNFRAWSVEMTAAPPRVNRTGDREGSQSQLGATDFGTPRGEAGSTGKKMGFYGRSVEPQKP
jgi:hypothetical protein